jgi:hypothetical protein
VNGSRHVSAVAWTLLAVAASSGCALHHTRIGTLQVDWSLNGTRTPSICPSYRADSIEITVDGDSREYLARDCRAFVTGIALSEGSYFGSARLLDVGGYPLTTSVDLGAVYVYPHETSLVSVEFPADSFY